MRFDYRKTSEEVAAERQRQYLELWPLEAQAEAVQDLLAGRPEKFEQLQADFAAIKAHLSYPE